MTEEIKESLEEIRTACDEIEEAIAEGNDGDEEPKECSSRGDPVVTLF